VKSKHPIKVTDVVKVFDDNCIRRLVETAKLPPTTDIDSFKEGIQCAARIYARDARIPNDNVVHREIEWLYHAAEIRDYQQVATLVKSLSPRAAHLLNKRGARLGPTNWFPAAKDFHNTRRQAAACARVTSLCRVGGHHQGRQRPTGKRSRTWQPLLYAPKPRRNFSKRDAERYFVILLKAAWLDATGNLPSRTADYRKPGPFARFVRECLQLVGGEYADAVSLINSTTWNHKRVIADVESNVRFGGKPDIDQPFMGAQAWCNTQ